MASTCPCPPPRQAAEGSSGSTARSQSLHAIEQHFSSNCRLLLNTFKAISEAFHTEKKIIRVQLGVLDPHFNFSAASN